MAMNDNSYGDEGQGEAYAARDPLFNKLRKWVSTDLEECVRGWREEATKDHAFFHGDQWSDKDKQALEEKRRPAITFNQVAPVVRAIAGTAITARQEVTYKGRGLEDTASADVWNEGARWFRDQKDAEDEEVYAFQDDIIAGLGFTETRLDYDEDPEGTPCVEHIDWQEMGFDYCARKRNLSDASRMWRARRMRRYDAKNLFPEADENDLDATWYERPNAGGSVIDREKSRRYESDSEGEREPSSDDEVTVVHVQWCEYEVFYRVRDPMTGRNEDLTREQIEILAQRLPMVAGSAQRHKRKIWKQAFIGADLLETGDNPVDGFTWQAMTCFYDPVKRLWYGMMRLMRDPQMWANKWRSQTLHLLNSTAKGGIMVEEGAVLNKPKFLDSWAKSDEISYVADGALTENRIRDKPVSPFPAGFYQLMEHAVNGIRDVTGVSLEMMGMREAEQAGVVENARRQQSMVMLAALFSSYKNYRKRQGRIMFQVMQRFVTPQRMAMILGDTFKEQAQQQGVPPQMMAMDLVQRAYASTLTYDIIVDEAPASPNLREQVWSTLQPMWSSFPPQVQAALFSYFPGPERVGREVQAAYQQALAPPPPPPPPPPEAVEQMRADIEKTRSETVENQAQAEETRAQAEGHRVDSALKQRQMTMPMPTIQRPRAA